MKTDTSKAKDWFIQALKAIRQGQSLNDFGMQVHPENRNIAYKAYKSALKYQKEIEYDALNAVAEAAAEAQALLNIAFNPGDEDTITLTRTSCQHLANSLKGALANLAKIRGQS